MDNQSHIKGPAAGPNGTISSSSKDVGSSLVENKYSNEYGEKGGERVSS